jgi:hypothetical protein
MKNKHFIFSLLILSKEEEISGAKIWRRVLLNNKADLTRNAVRCKENLTLLFSKRQVKLALLI